MNKPHIPFLKILFALLSVVFAYIYLLKHSDNYQPTQVIYNDGYAKMGSSGYNPFKEAPEAEEVKVVETETVVEEHGAAEHKDEHKAEPKKEEKKAEPKGHGHH